jgi:hypothetical protein
VARRVIRVERNAPASLQGAFLGGSHEPGGRDSLACEFWIAGADLRSPNGRAPS